MTELHAGGGRVVELGRADFACQPATPPPFWEQHYPVAYWAKCWGFSAKTVREWFQEEFGPGILRQANKGRRLKRDYVTLYLCDRRRAGLRKAHRSATYQLDTEVM
jgi:hypothetical protein